MYLCTVKIEDAIQTKRFRNEFHKLHVNVIFSAWWLKNQTAAGLKKHGLSHEQFNVLRIVRGQKDGPLCVKDITARMLERSSNTTRIIDKLEAKNLVSRNPAPHDRRELHILLTDAGARLLEQIDEEWKSMDPVSLPISQEEAALLNQLLDKMRGG